MWITLLHGFNSLFYYRYWRSHGALSVAHFDIIYRVDFCHPFCTVHLLKTSLVFCCHVEFVSSDVDGHHLGKISGSYSAAVAKPKWWFNGRSVSSQVLTVDGDEVQCISGESTKLDLQQTCLWCRVRFVCDFSLHWKTISAACRS